MRELSRKIQEEAGDGVEVLPVQMDISKTSEIKQFVENLPQRFKEIDVLVNNA